MDKDGYFDYEDAVAWLDARTKHYLFYAGLYEFDDSHADEAAKWFELSESDDSGR